MAGRPRVGNPGGKKRQALPKYFFLNGTLHRRLGLNRPKDILVAWNYPKAEKVVTSYSATMQRHGKAFTTRQVCELVNRGYTTVHSLIQRGEIKTPQHTYHLETGNKFQYLWSEEDVIELLECLSNIHRGRPRQDGEITITDLPSIREVRAMMHNESILYVKQGDTFVPTWKARDI